MKSVSLQEAVSGIGPGSRVFVQGAAMTPTSLLNALCDRYQELSEVVLMHIHTEGEARYTKAPYKDAFKTISCFVAANLRDAVASGQADYVPVFLSEIHLLFRKNIFRPDYALIQVSPPDRHGYCSLGSSVDITLAALGAARKVIALINPQVPRTHGDGIIHQSKIDLGVQTDQPLYELACCAPTPEELAIGSKVASLIEDGATLQMGIGSIPNAVLQQLGNHRRLGIHTEMFSDGLLPLIRKGVITGEEKEIKRGKVVTSFAMGSRELYDFIDDNPAVHFKEASYTNDTAIIRKLSKMTAINSALEIDLYGQVCADTLGPKQYSGVGGQLDFIRGASLSENGKPIIAMPSVTSGGLSKIVSRLKPGSAVTTTRAHVHYVVTEHGIAELFGKSLRERAEALIALAHPDHREALEREAFNMQLTR